MKQKRIGIVGWKTGDNSFGATVPYLEFIRDTIKAEVIILSPSFNIDHNLDLLILPGGKDTMPNNGQIPSFNNSDIDTFKEFFYLYNLSGYIDNKIPIFGICLGHQLLAKWMGVTIKQNLTDHAYSRTRDELCHSVFTIKNYKKVINDLNTEKVNVDKKYLESKEFMSVNSMHHQGIELESLESFDDLKAELVSLDGIVEAMSCKKFNFHSVQWHPEEILDEYSSRMIELLLHKEESQEESQEESIDLPFLQNESN